MRIGFGLFVIKLAPLRFSVEIQECKQTVIIQAGFHGRLSGVA